MRLKDKFTDLIRLFIKKNRNKLAPKTLYNYNIVRRKIHNEFPELTIREVNEDFIQEYIHRFRHNQNATLRKDISIIRRVLEWAYKRKIISRMPLIEFDLPTQEAVRTYLTKEELEKLWNYYEENKTNLPAGIKNSLKLFLFQSYTGLRYSDAINLRSKNIIKDKEGNKYIQLSQKKTKRIVMVPLHPRAEGLLELNKDTGRYFRWQRVQIVNKNLKKVANRAGIEKRISTHVARHTFAMLSLQAGIDLQAIQDFLGHKRISTTQIYAKLLPETKLKEFEKLKKFLGE